MFLRAALLSLALLLASRVLGLVRDSALAAAFGVSAAADIAVLMLTVPDWLAGLLAAGALSYVLLPTWATLDAAQVALLQRRVFRTLLVCGGALAMLLLALQDGAIRLVLPAVDQAHALAQARLALGFSVVVLPMALVSALWVTRLQHERDAVGMYGASLVVNGVLVVALLAVAAQARQGTGHALGLVGTALVAAMLLRLGWLWSRLPAPPVAPVVPPATPSETTIAWPGPLTWFMAIAAAGLPLALPFVARSLAARAGEGELAVFTYAWKLVELPSSLGIQLVATLAFAGIAQAVRGAARRQPGDPSDGLSQAQAAIGPALMLAWAIAWACLLALVVGSQAIAQLLFGWGRMPAAEVSRVAQWGVLGALSLPALALGAVLATVLASQSRLAWVALPHALALAVLLGLGAVWQGDGPVWLLVLAALYAGVALAMVAGLGRLALGLPWRELGLLALLPAAACAAAVWAAWPGRVALWSTGAGLGLAVLAGLTVMAWAWLVSPRLRQALQRRRANR